MDLRAHTSWHAARNKGQDRYMADKGKIMQLETDYPDDPRTGTRVRYADGTAFGSPHAAPAHVAGGTMVESEEVLCPLYPSEEDAEVRVFGNAITCNRSQGSEYPRALRITQSIPSKAKEGASKLQLSLARDVPGAPHTETLIFATGRGTPIPPSDDIRDIALRVLRDGVALTPETVTGLCNALLDLDARLSHKSEQLEIALLQLGQARGASQAYALDLKAEREAVLQAEVLRRAALEDALQQRTLAIQLSEENRRLHLESSAYLDLQVVIEEDPSWQWDEDEHTVVQDVPCGGDFA